MSLTEMMERSGTPYYLKDGQEFHGFRSMFADLKRVFFTYTDVQQRRYAAAIDAEDMGELLEERALTGVPFALDEKDSYSLYSKIIGMHKEQGRHHMYDGDIETDLQSGARLLVHLKQDLRIVPSEQDVGCVFARYLLIGIDDQMKHLAENGIRPTNLGVSALTQHILAGEIDSNACWQVRSLSDVTGFKPSYVLRKVYSQLLSEGRVIEFKRLYSAIDCSLDDENKGLLPLALSHCIVHGRSAEASYLQEAFGVDHSSMDPKQLRASLDALLESGDQVAISRVLPAIGLTYGEASSMVDEKHRDAVRRVWANKITFLPRQREDMNK